MKKINYIKGILLALTMIAVSCADFVEPNIPYKDFNTGAYLRTIARTSDSFNYFDLENSRFALTLEAVDAEGGNTVETVEIRVRHTRLITGVGIAYTPASVAGAWTDVLVKTMTLADFAPNPESRFLRASFDIPFEVAAEALGLSAADIEGGDTFEFRLVLNDRFGRVFSNHNRSSDVSGGFFYASPFQYNVGVVCPSDLSETGDIWTATSVSNFGTSTADVTVNPVSGNDIQYIISDVSAGLYESFDFDTVQEGVYEDACGVISWVRAGNTEFALNDPGETGSYDADLGILTIFWFDSGNDIRGTTTLVKK